MKQVFTLLILLTSCAYAGAQELELEADEKTIAEQPEAVEVQETVTKVEPVVIKAVPATCYQKWESVFSARGADKVVDGTHRNVIITVRKDDRADCYLGTARVKEGVIEHIYGLVEGGTHELWMRNYQAQTPMTIYNGVSKTRITVDDELINVMFIDNLKPKGKALVRAPDPTID